MNFVLLSGVKNLKCPSFAPNLISIGQEVFSQLKPEKWPLPVETYIAHKTLQSANAVQCGVERKCLSNVIELHECLSVEENQLWPVNMYSFVRPICDVSSARVLDINETCMRKHKPDRKIERNVRNSDFRVIVCRKSNP